jgi:hypothetical protein
MSESSSLVELVELLLSIDENDPSNEQNAFVLFDKDGNKILL